jgi:CheY-like chemotaxis protein
MGFRVLVVDDTASVRQTLERALERRGHVVESAASGEEALALLKRTTVDVLLLDLRMPRMSGRTLFQRILAERPELVGRIAVISGDPEAEDHAAWLRMHDLPVLPKPFSLEAAFDLVERLGTRDPGVASGPEA